MPRIAATALLALSLLGLAAAQDAKPARVGLPYMLPNCVVSGEPLGDDPVVVIVEGQKKAGDNARANSILGGFVDAGKTITSSMPI